MNRFWQTTRSALAMLASLGIMAGCEPWSDLEDYDREEVPVYWAETLTPPAIEQARELKIMTWNFKFGGARIDFFFDYWGDRSVMTTEEVQGNLDGLMRLINEIKPDVLIAEEVDVNSKRSGYVDMLQYTLDHTDLNYGAFYEAWDTRYAPDQSVGRALMGNAIFSIYPIAKAERIRSADRTDQAIYESYFLLHRVIGRAEIEAGNHHVAAYDVHAEAYDEDGTKKKHVDQFHQLMIDETLPVVLGGDFNNIPPTSLKREKFNDDSPDAVGTRYESPPYDLDAMQAFYDDFNPAITLARFGDTQESQRLHFSHTIIGPDHIANDGLHGFWNRKIDYLWIKKDQSWKPGSTDTLQNRGRMGITQEPMTLSDHCPLIGTWELGS